MSTVTAKFNRFTTSGKSAVVLIKANAFQFNSSVVYLPAQAVLDALDCTADEAVKGMPFDIPSGFDMVDMVDSETGEVRQTKDGVNLKQLEWPVG